MLMKWLSNKMMSPQNFCSVARLLNFLCSHMTTLFVLLIFICELENPGTLLYHLSVPKGDVGDSLAGTPNQRPKSSTFDRRGAIPRFHSPGAQVAASGSSLETTSNRLIAKMGSGSRRYSRQYPRRGGTVFRISPSQDEWVTSNISDTTASQAKQTQCWRLPTNRDAQRDTDEANLTPIRRAGTHRYGAISDRDSQRRSIWHQHQLRKGRSRGRRKIIGITAR
ncbi:uncharacterized protein N7479_001637 [Penicillium vulpinum]|uniref:uncharacterized protein n=1 Tax=Penicillium vulpinum TaxID=29845 RepID=UPI00254790DC|nr:uncharacterized protein N7479_001637 [Penicillium vulpinum]KAJ5971719.1 hypothetical protein N7479_001637 [Penicillium vulpinum]